MSNSERQTLTRSKGAEAESTLFVMVEQLQLHGLRKVLYFDSSSKNDKSLFVNKAGLRSEFMQREDGSIIMF